MAQRVVHHLEVVEVALEDRAESLRAGRFALVGKALLHEQPVRKPRQGVAKSALADLVLGPAAALVLDAQVARRGRQGEVLLAKAHDQVRAHEQREPHQHETGPIEVPDEAPVDQRPLDRGREEHQKVDRERERLAMLALAVL